MIKNRLLKTTVFRLALLYASGFSVLLAVALGYSYWSVVDHLEERTDERLTAELKALTDTLGSSGPEALAQAVDHHNRSGSQIWLHYLLVDPDGQPLAGDPTLWPIDVTGPPTPTSAVTTKTSFVDNGVESSREMRWLATILDNGNRLLVGHDVNVEGEILSHAAGVALGAVSVAVVLALLGGVVMGYRVLRRIARVNLVSVDIMRGDFSKRLPVGQRGDEFDELAETVNSMLAQIEQLMDSMREISDNVAHDLRSPLSRLRGRLEITLLESRDEQEYRAAIERTLIDVEQLLATFNALLDIASAEAGASHFDSAPVNLSEIAGELAELYEALAAENSQVLTLNLAPKAEVRGNRELLAQALSNLLDNAIKYSAAGKVEVSTTFLEEAPVLSVADDGPGVPVSEHRHVLERFVRLDEARSSPGNGLGLSLVNAVAKLHRAEIRLEDNEPGLRVRLSFPPYDAPENHHERELPSTTATNTRDQLVGLPGGSSLGTKPG